jgi:hypothetical protein
MNKRERKEWLAYRRVKESALLDHDGVTTVMGPSVDVEAQYPAVDIVAMHSDRMDKVAVELEQLAVSRAHTIHAKKRGHSGVHKAAVNGAIQARRKLDADMDNPPNMPFTVTGESIYMSPEGVLWTREAHKDMGLIRLLDQVKTLSAAEKRGAYNVLVNLPNTASLYFRDSVFAIAWEKHYSNLGKRGIVRELASTLWMIKHLRLYGFSTQYAIERLQGVLKTNKIESMFHSSSIDDMIRNQELEACHTDEYAITESDYAQTFGEAVNPAQSTDISSGAVIPLDRQLEFDVHAYLEGLGKLIKARIERYVDMGMYAFIISARVGSPVKGVDNFTNRLFHGFIKHEGLTVSDFDGILSKRMFLTYVYTYYRKLDVYGVTAHYTDSFNLTQGGLASNPVWVEKASREAGEAMGPMGAGKPKAPVVHRKTIVDGRVSSVKRPLLRNYNYAPMEATDAGSREDIGVHGGDRRNWQREENMAKRILLEDGQAVGIVLDITHGKVTVVFPAVSESKRFVYSLAQLRKYGRYAIVEDNGELAGIAP